MKWKIKYDSEVRWNMTLRNLNKCMSSMTGIKISWKFVHNIIYMEQKLFRICNSNNGKCRFYKIENKTLTHLFHIFSIIMVVLECMFDAFYNDNVLNIFQWGRNILGMHDYNKKYNAITNKIMDTVKWIVWKCRNIIK